MSSLWEGLRDKLIAQNYRCAYTGKALILGVNASVDHILPVARFPQLISDLHNIEWVDLQVNQMKRDLTRDEFLSSICQILEYSQNQKAQRQKAA
jgi:5-methylcytosine-specific restriction endonuclease McrA